MGTTDCRVKLDHIQCWAKANKLSLNCAKSKQIVLRARCVRGATTQLPSPIDCIERVHKITALGVVVNDQLTSTDHISSLLTSCSSLLYALRVLRHHGLPNSSLHDVLEHSHGKDHVLRTCVVRFQLSCRPQQPGILSLSLQTDWILDRRYAYCNWTDERCRW